MKRPASRHVRCVTGRRETRVVWRPPPGGTIFTLGLGPERCSEDVDVLRHLRALVLGNAFRDPDDIANLLLAQLDVSPEEAKMKLLLKGRLVVGDLQLEEGVLYGLVLLRTKVGPGRERRWPQTLSLFPAPAPAARAMSAPSVMMPR